MTTYTQYTLTDTKEHRIKRALQVTVQSIILYEALLFADPSLWVCAL